MAQWKTESCFVKRVNTNEVWGTIVEWLWSQFNSEQAIKLLDAPLPSTFPSPRWFEKKLWILGDGRRWMGVQSSNNNFWNEGWPSEKQNHILSRDSTPMKDEAPQLTQPQSQFNLEQPIKSPDAPSRSSLWSLCYDVKRCCDRRAVLCFLLCYLCGRRY